MATNYRDEVEREWDEQVEELELDGDFYAEDVMPELPVPRVKDISKIPFELSQLVAKKKEKKIELKTPVTIEPAAVPSGDMTKITVNGVERLIKKKIKLSQRKPKEADALVAFKVKLGIPVKTPVFYRYIRTPQAKRADPKWKGIKRDACVLVYPHARGQFIFSFSVWNGKDPKVFSKDKARKLCQDKLRAGITVTLTNTDLESSHLENIKRASDNHFFALNKRVNEPMVQAMRIGNLDSLKQLASLIKQKFNMET